MGRCPLALPLAALIALILLGWYPGSRIPDAPAALGTAEYSAEILSIREAETSGRLAVAEVNSVNGQDVAPFKVRLHFLNEGPILSAGQELSFCSELKALPAPIDIPDARDLQADLRRQGVTVTAEVLTDSIRHVANVAGPRAWLLRANSSALHALRQAPVSDQSIDMLAAMLFGDAQYIDAPERNIYSAAGLSHILALSGMHVAVVAMIITCALWPLYLTRHKRTRLLLTVIALWLYAAFTAFSPSVTRAVIMASVYLGGRIIQRHSLPMNSLCLAAMLILAFNPMDMYSLGFQLSFAAVAGIILFYPLINRVNRREHPRLYWLVSFPALSLSAMIFAGIVSALHFHTFPLLFIVSNILVAPLVPLFIISGLFSMALGIVGLTDWLASAIDWVAQTTAGVPWATIPNLYPSWLFVLALIASLWVFALARKKRIALILPAVVLTIACAKPAAIYPEREQFVLADSHHTYLIRKEGTYCTLHTTAKLADDRQVALDFYSLILQDYMSKRDIDSMRLAPPDSLPTDIIDGRPCVVLLDSCSPGKIAYEYSL